jgi:ribosomal protein S18 acetylase RimI-like enzyme
MVQQLVRVVDPLSADFDQAWAIYVEALPARERKPRAAIEALLSRDDYRFFVLTQEEGIVAFAIYFLSGSHPFALLEYMGSRSDVRGRGIGTALFDHGLAEIGGPSLLAEVESDREAGADHSIRARRKGFYRRLGCRQVMGLPYVMPTVSGDAPPLMDLLIRPAPAAAPLARARLRAWLEEIYVAVYAQRLPDPRIDAMLAGVADPVRLGEEE